MTDRLSTLMHGEVETLDIPGVPAAEIMSAGRRIHRRRRTARILACSTAVVLAGVGFAVVMHEASSPSRFQPVSPSARLAPSAGAISLDQTIYLDNGRVHANLPQRSAGVFYTSAGVLVRTSATGHTDNGDPYHFVLVGPHGQTDPLDLEVGRDGLDAVPSQPYLVRTQVHDGTVDVVVFDVSTDHEVARVALPGHPTWRRYSSAPPVSLDGDTAYVATAGTAYAVQWRTGTVTPNGVIGTQFGPVRGGHVVDQEKGDVLDVATGKTLLHYETAGAGPAVLSWDGRYLLVSRALGNEFDASVYDVETGHRVVLRSVTAETWTPDGYVFSTYDFSPRTHVSVCAPDTGRCVSHPFPYAARMSRGLPSGSGVEEIVGGEWFQ